MAPRGSRPGREAKPVATKARASNRAGVTKRKGRVDGDGDMDMDGSAARRLKTGGADAASKSRTSTRAANRTRPTKIAQTVAKHLGNGTGGDLASRVKTAVKGASLVYLRVHGMKQSKAAANPDGGLKDLLSFIERKATSLLDGRRTRQVIIKKSHVAGDYVFIGASEADAVEILKINGFTFAGTPIEILESDDGLGIPNKATESKETKELRERLQRVLSLRYVAETKLLKLDELKEDPELKALGMFDNRDRALKTFKGLMAICESLFKTAQAKRDAIESVTLAKNNIDNVSQVEALAVTFPDIKNLDLSSNQLPTLQSIERYKGKFKSLQTLYIADNPIMAADPNLPTTLMQWFPKLQDINGTQVRTPEQIAAEEEARKPKPIPQHGPDFRDVGKVAEGFLMEVFKNYDSKNQQFVSTFYDDASQFSLAVDTRSVRDPNAPAPLPWAAYLKFSRNLVKINAQNARTQRLFKGAASIFSLWQTLPFTKHPDIVNELNKYIMDCHPIAGLADPTGQDKIGVTGLIVSCHGEFLEHDEASKTQGKRSFSRTFILGPSRPGSGSSFRVVSDMLSLRAYSPLPNVHVAEDMEQKHQQMIMELCKRTNMVPEYSRMCLEQAKWDFEKALVSFEQNKANIPPEAYAPPQ